MWYFGPYFANLLAYGVKDIAVIFFYLWIDNNIQLCYKGEPHILYLTKMISTDLAEIFV